LVEDGADIAVNCRADAAAASETVMASEVVGVGRVVDIVVNNGGIASRGRRVSDTDPAELERVIRTHAIGPHHLSRLVLPSMRERERGDIVMISSVATLAPPPMVRQPDDVACLVRVW